MDHLRVTGDHAAQIPSDKSGNLGDSQLLAGHGGGLPLSLPLKTLGNSHLGRNPCCDRRSDPGSQNHDPCPAVAHPDTGHHSDHDILEAGWGFTGIGTDSTRKEENPSTAPHGKGGGPIFPCKLGKSSGGNEEFGNE